MLRSICSSVLVIVGAVLAPMATAQAFDTRATAAYVYDQTTGTVLLEKNADDPLPPASMSKLMTLYMAFEAISPLGDRPPALTIDDRLQVTSHCQSYGGSTMFLNTQDRPRVEDLIRGVVVLSGNDASCVLGEALSPDGSEPGFAASMTQRARQLGMMNSTFANASGWPAAGHRMSMRDLGILADRLITDFPTFYPLFAEETFEFDGRAPANVSNRNPLLGLGIGADGLKTGHTQAAGYGLVGSAKQGDRRIVFVITGLDTAQERAEEAQRIVNWAFRQFAEQDVARGGVRIAEADVWMGEASTVGLTLADDLRLLVPTIGSDEIDAEVIYTGPIQAPISAGDEIAELVIRLDNLPETRVPLIAESDVALGGFNTRLRTAADVLLARINEETGDAAAATANEAE
ncbi:MAG: D-alanyl-D-alanine carboxypeptidase family protein [Pseudomonadota bacterium]